MKILAIGDIYGETGRKVLKQRLAAIKQQYQIDLTIANVENATHGKGLSQKHYRELKQLGIEVMTSGNHIFFRQETREFIKQVPELLRPLNANPYHPGNGSYLIKVKDKNIRITNLIGTSLMPSAAENPYYALEKLLQTTDCDLHLVDFHAEATAEKIALALHFDGQINALWGTHTHVQTADERILPKGTGFITDLGMTGPHGGIIGADPQVIFQRNKLGLNSHMQPFDDYGQLNAAVFTFDDNNNQLLNIERINIVFNE